MAEKNIETVFTRLVSELYQNGDAARLDTAVTHPIATLRGAPQALANIIDEYRTGLRRLPKQPKPAEGQSWSNPQPIFNDFPVINARAKAKLSALITEVEAAVAQVRTSVTQVRAAHNLGPHQRGATNVIGILRRAAEYEQEILAGIPRLQEAIRTASESLGTQEGGKHMTLPGWGETEQISQHEHPVVEEAEKPWYLSLSGAESYERMRNKTVLIRKLIDNPGVL